MGQILKIGIPIALQDGFIQVAFMIITIIANQRGLNYLQVHFLSGYFYAYGLSIVSFIHNSISIVCARIPLSYYAATHFQIHYFRWMCGTGRIDHLNHYLCWRTDMDE